MRFRWLLLSTLGTLLFCSPAEAGTLLRAQFDANARRLVFITSEGVRPTAVLISNPTRLVIDLPGTDLRGGTKRESLRGLISNWRVGQPDDQTTRIVIELAPGYTMEPDDIKIQGTTPSQWSAQLPMPEPEPAREPEPPENPTTSSGSEPTTSTRPTETAARIEGFQIDDFQITRSGFFLTSSGQDKPKDIRVNRSRDRRKIEIEIEGATLSQSLLEETEREINEYQVSEVQFERDEDYVRIILNVDRNSPDWRARYSSIGEGIVIFPREPID